MSGNKNPRYNPKRIDLKKVKERNCKCGCGNKIEIKKYHRFYGIPEYLSGHFSKDKKRPEHSKFMKEQYKTGKRVLTGNFKLAKEGKLIGDKNPMCNPKTL